MRYYELIYIVSSNVERKKNDQAMKEIGEKIQETGSKIINHIVWGKKKLAYPIKNNTPLSHEPRVQAQGAHTERACMDPKTAL